MREAAEKRRKANESRQKANRAKQQVSLSELRKLIIYFLLFNDFLTKLDRIFLFQAAVKQRQEEEADDQANKISNEIDALERKKQRIQDKIDGTLKI